MKHPINILSTRPVEQQLIQEAVENGITIDCISFIETIVSVNKAKKERIQAIAQKENTIVFTSMNAAEAIV